MDDGVDFFLAGYPEPIISIAARLRAVVKQAQPTSIERLRSGWALIGYDLPLRRGKRYFAFIAPEREHIHLGFEYGAWMADPERALQGAELRLKRVRYLTFKPGAVLDTNGLVTLVREAAAVACLSPAERLARSLDLSQEPARTG